MIELSYSHGKPSTSADVMTPIRRAFELAEQPGGGKYAVTASGRVDDSVSVKVDGTRKNSKSGSVHNFSLTFENLSPGLHCLHVKHNNINYYPEPTGNISLIDGTVGPCPPVTIIPGENDKDECECPCGFDDEDDGGGGSSSSSSRSSSRTRLPLRLASSSSGGSSSAGRSVVRAATLQYMRWGTSFGVFRGMGGIPRGRLEMTGYDGYDASLLTPAALAYRHPAASAVLVPEGGIVPNAMFRVYEGGGYFNYVCDAEGMEAFGVGATSSDTRRVQFVTALSREESVVTTLDMAGYLRVAKTDGSAVFYNLTTGEFRVLFPPKTPCSRQQAESYLAVLRQEDGTLRQLWNLWDGHRQRRGSTPSRATRSRALPSAETRRRKPSPSPNETGHCQPPWNLLLPRGRMPRASGVWLSAKGAKPSPPPKSASSLRRRAATVSSPPSARGRPPPPSRRKTTSRTPWANCFSPARKGTAPRKPGPPPMSMTMRGASSPSLRPTEAKPPTSMTTPTASSSPRPRGRAENPRLVQTTYLDDGGGIRQQARKKWKRTWCWSPVKLLAPRRVYLQYRRPRQARGKAQYR